MAFVPQDPVAVDTPEQRAPEVSVGLHQLLWSPVWDIAMRGVGFWWTGFLLFINIKSLAAFIQSDHDSMSLPVFASAIGARIGFIAFLAPLVFFFVIRLKPLAKAPGTGPRVVALFGTFLPTMLGVLPRYEESAVINIASFTCIAISNVLSAYGFSHLSRSASIMAEARRLVTTGPYRLVRHPVYLFEELAVLGVTLTHLWPTSTLAIALVIFAAHAWCQFKRMRNEEDVLHAAFPEYEEYKRQTPRLVPGVY